MCAFTRCARDHRGVKEDQSPAGFASSERAVAERRANARRLIGKRIVEVRYVDLDLRGWDLGHHDQARRRDITDMSEWQQPNWDRDGVHHIGFGIEFTDEDREMWSITWDPPAETCSLRLQQERVSDFGAVWDVSSREPWRGRIESPITDVQSRYHPWGETGTFWCSRISLSFGGGHVEVLLGDWGRAQLVPSADNVAVLWDPTPLPAWERTDDLV